ncbi:MAG: hypothetical protein E7158_01985 [Firmicutes bacterium]|nr:hypothetical protein [Bacillota bacterium]
MAKEKNEKIETVDLKQIKEELTKYVDEKINTDFIKEIDKSNKRLIKEKNKKVFFRDIIIVILLCLSGFLSYKLYRLGYFNKFMIKVDNNKNEREESIDNQIEETKKEEISLEELIKKYGSYLNNVVISENSDYLNDFYEGNLTTELKNYIAFNLVNFTDFETEEDYNIISDDLIAKSYENIFEDKYTTKTFKYNGETIKYISSLKSYITDKILDSEETNIKREIINIETKDNKVVITTVEGIVKNKKLYNVISKEEVKEYDNKKLSNYVDSLNKVSYIFNEDGKLENIE